MTTTGLFLRRLLPEVRIRHPDHQHSVADVPMLIDSGADTTLLPKPAAASLGIASTGERYPVVSFDGTTSEAEAVRADLEFLNKRFRGRFLLIDAEIGIIGRNVLNNVRLLLDGPALTREEMSTTTRDA
jgi:hypothetical protein